MKTIVAGSRKGLTQEDVNKAISECGFKITEVVSGCAEGGDKMGEVWAENNGVKIKKMPADWNDLSHPDAIIKTNKFGKKYDARAGIRRNHEMGDYAEALVAIWDGMSKGTKDMIGYATKKGLVVYVHKI